MGFKVICFAWYEQGSCGEEIAQAVRDGARARLKAQGIDYTKKIKIGGAYFHHFHVHYTTNALRDAIIDEALQRGLTLYTNHSLGPGIHDLWIKKGGLLIDSLGPLKKNS